MDTLSGHHSRAMRDAIRDDADGGGHEEQAEMTQQEIGGLAEWLAELSAGEQEGGEEHHAQDRAWDGEVQRLGDDFSGKLAGQEEG